MRHARAGRPAALQRDGDEHQALRVKRRPTDEEDQHHGNCGEVMKLTFVLTALKFPLLEVITSQFGNGYFCWYILTQHSDDRLTSFVEGHLARAALARRLRLPRVLVAICARPRGRGRAFP